MRAITTALAIFVATGAWIAAAAGQEPQENPISVVQEDPYARAILEILDRWNAGDLILDKKNATPDFEARFRRYVEPPPDNRFLVERWLPAQGIAAQWTELPEVLKPELDLTPGAKLLIASTVLDKTKQLQSVAPPNPDDLQKALASSLYVTLGTAQKEAQEQGKTEIDATAVQRGGVRLFSLGWPFCCATEAP